MGMLISRLSNEKLKRQSNHAGACDDAQRLDLECSLIQIVPKANDQRLVFMQLGRQELQQMAAFRLVGHPGVGHGETFAIGIFYDRAAVHLADLPKPKRMDGLFVSQWPLEIR